VKGQGEMFYVETLE